LISIKSGVRVAGMSPEALLAIVVAESVYAEFNESKQCVVTSVTDGQHKAGSLHHTGRAVDLRNPSNGGLIGSIVAMLRSRLGADYDVIPEVDHIHIEHDPKRLGA
jgi:hypothetical protein